MNAIATLKRNRPFLMLAAVSAVSMVGLTPADAAPPELTVVPTAASATTLAPGVTHLSSGAIAYRPANLPAGPRPLIVALHGAGRAPGEALDIVRDRADREGLLVLAPKSTRDTWDIVDYLRKEGGVRSQEEALRGFGPDIKRIDTALGELFAKAQVDPSKIVLLGFSDGGSYALSVGLSNPKLFSGIVALSPGAMLAPNVVATSQRIFIAHGRSDHVVPFQDDKLHIADPLTAAGLHVLFRPFQGDHQVDPKALDEGVSYALGETSPAAPAH